MRGSVRLARHLTGGLPHGFARGACRSNAPSRLPSRSPPARCRGPSTRRRRCAGGALRRARRGGACLRGQRDGAALLAAIGGHSPFLAELALREPATLLRVAERGPEAGMEIALDPLFRADPDAGRAGVAALLRQAKRQAALIAAVADLSGAWPLDRVTGALSDLADACTDYACAHLLREAAGGGEIRLAGGAARHDPRATGRGSGLVVLGMGKLGGRELNYSSDIDLMVLYDPTAAAYDADRAGAIYVRLARELVRLLEERTEDGYVFRTDLRLRPDPAATPLAVSLPAAITYYESMGQNWERAAMIKARPVAGDRALGEGFLREIRPFVWRRTWISPPSPTSTPSSARSTPTRATRARGAGGAVAGHDVKLGRGGIREIEFTTQVLQLIWGGRDPALRDPTTLGALSALAAAGRIERRAAADLADAYVFLRTSSTGCRWWPTARPIACRGAGDLARIASFMGFDGMERSAPPSRPHEPGGSSAAMPGCSSRRPPSRPRMGAGQPRLHRASRTTRRRIATLRGLGFENPSAVAAIVRGWHHGRTRATRSERARELLTALMPTLLAAFGRQTHPGCGADAAGRRARAHLRRRPGAQPAASQPRPPRPAGLRARRRAAAGRPPGAERGGAGRAPRRRGDGGGDGRRRQPARPGQGCPLPGGGAGRRPGALVVERMFEIDAARPGKAGSTRMPPARRAARWPMPRSARCCRASPGNSRRRHGKVPGARSASSRSASSRAGTCCRPPTST
jgi:glutamate-ammonia-ligase adenylyltransferase